jgi:hypothetical protein
MEVTRRWGRRHKKLLDDLKYRRRYLHLKEKALDRTVWRNCFGGGFGPVVRILNEWMMFQGKLFLWAIRRIFCHSSWHCSFWRVSILLMRNRYAANLCSGGWLERLYFLLETKSAIKLWL